MIITKMQKSTTPMWIKAKPDEVCCVVKFLPKGTGNVGATTQT